MNVIITILLAAGTFFFMVGVVGLLRLPDVYTRMHATTKCDTLGAGLILLALALYSGISEASVKLLFMILFIWITNPTSAHVIARAAFLNKARVCEGSYELDKTGEVRCSD
ncbi:monovalent cation/H(+) antiporter subunit G [Dethiobacter alkaliphilus]|uniref:Monovalent cation/proton antiporter, MnhG/PhaG subunit n=1 Tax=Dethiobacter alkaliphilus AHT 1 TaxID=555088 RepID=C0GEX6_DETAL|nr:monovalent cation/H(+) antiporter subunit G [Dethiobacter alkaliphilus]EEG78158.1 monovalent cation/proton antiporter, MnhG/PhaG subunit [Dethiobacter alkaliphilus AHT 1]